MPFGGVLAHGDAPPAPTPADVLGAWSFEPVVWLGVALAAWLYRRGARRVRGWPPARSWCATGGLAALLVALSGPPAVYDDSVLWVHMVQHLLLMLVAAPLLAYAGPVTLALRARRPRVLVAAVRSRAFRAAVHPLTAWAAFGGVMWGTHYSGLYDAAADDAMLHVFEHGLYLAAALSFWSPVAGVDPGRKVARPLRVAYLLAALPVQSFLGLALYSADEPLYDHYATVARTWGPDPLEDQRLAGIAMWVGGDAVLLGWAGIAAAAWLRAEEG